MKNPTRMADAGLRIGVIRDPQSAFTLIELMAVIAVIGLMVVVSIPAMRGMSGSNQLANAGRQFNNALMAARQEAITQNAYVRVMVAYDETIRGGSLTDDQKGMNCSAYAIMWQPPLTGWQAGASSAQPNLPLGQNTWRYIKAWQSLPKGVVFDPAKEDLRTANGNVSLPATTIFFGQQASPTNNAETTRDLMPFPDDLGKTPTPLAYVEFRPGGTPAVAGSVRLVAGFAEPSTGKLTVMGRASATSAKGSTDPAGVNCVVLQWDDVVGRVQWIQPGR